MIEAAIGFEVSPEWRTWVTVLRLQNVGRNVGRLLGRLVVHP
jgi:hypothetical protein